MEIGMCRILLSRRRWIGLPLALGVALTIELAAQPQAWSPRNANYQIRVSLNPQEKTLEGTEIIRWRNITEVATQELWFHLYYNAWRNNKSTWLREAVLRRAPRLSKLQEQDWGFCQVESVTLRAGENGPAQVLATRFESPDDNNPDDRTVMVAVLPQPVEPGHTIEVEVVWKGKIPRTFARTGFRGNFFFLAQWFPKLGVFQGDEDWNCHQFHAGTEFFSDYGNYDVQINVPLGWKVGATGVEQGVTEEDRGSATHRYLQEDVHDFAWTTSPDYREAHERFDVPGLQAVDLRLLYQPEHEGQVARHFRAAKAALQYYGGWYGEYPYGHLTLIDPAWNSGAGGMEYPTLFTCGTRYFNPVGGGSPEGVTVHEAGHQFWFGLVGNNEFENAWLDEGLNTFSTARTMDVAFGPSSYVRRFFQGLLPLKVDSIKRDRIQGSRLNGYRSAARSDAEATPSYLYYPASGSAITYNKTALWLAMLERDLGWETLQKILSTFFERWKFRHPKPDDFFEVASGVAGRDLSGFFDQVFERSVVFDFSVSRAESRRVEALGWVGEEGALRYASAEEEADSEDEALYETEVVVRRLEDGVLPVEVLLKFEGGEEFREVWDARAEWKLYKLVKSSKLEYAAVDPERKILLDINYTNNSRLREAESSLPATKWASKWMFWLQDYLETLSFLL
ncbi:MAG: M1 family metallopeptidase [Acidobacteriota bacterium]